MRSGSPPVCISMVLMSKAPAWKGGEAMAGLFDGDRRVSGGDRRVFDGDRRVVEADPAVLLAGQRAAVAVHLRQGAVAVALRIGEFGKVVGTAGQQRQRRGGQGQGANCGPTALRTALRHRFPLPLCGSSPASGTA